MAEYKCNDFHKFGPFIKNENNGFHRKCLCCLEKRNYPNSEEIMEEIKKQEDASALLNVLLYQDISTSFPSDDYITLIGCLFDNLSYLYLNQETQDKFIKKTSIFNEYFHNDKETRYQIINEFIYYLKLYFKKENMEIRLGLNSFPEDEAMELDLIYNAIKNKFDTEIEKIYDSKNQKNHLQNR